MNEQVETFAKKITEATSNRVAPRTQSPIAGRPERGRNIRQVPLAVVLPQEVGNQAVIADIDVQVAVFIKVGGRQSTGRVGRPLGPPDLLECPIAVV